MGFWVLGYLEICQGPKWGGRRRQGYTSEFGEEGIEGVGIERWFISIHEHLIKSEYIAPLSNGNPPSPSLPYQFL